jgi:hypothetical protein
MRKLLAVLLVALALAATNPSKEEFREHVQNEVVASAREAGRDGLVQAAQAIKDLTSVDLVRLYANRLVDGAERRNLLLFSLYSVPVDETRHVWLGIGKRFFRLS